MRKTRFRKTKESAQVVSLVNLGSPRAGVQPRPASSILLSAGPRLQGSPEVEAAAFPPSPLDGVLLPTCLFCLGAKPRLSRRGLLTHRAPSSASWGWKPRRLARPGEGTVCPGSLAHTQRSDKAPIQGPPPRPQATTRIQPAEGTRWEVGGGSGTITKGLIVSLSPTSTWADAPLPLHSLCLPSPAPSQDPGRWLPCLPASPL